MSFGRRLFRAAERTLREGLEHAVGGTQSAYDAARAELEDHLKWDSVPSQGAPNRSGAAGFDRAEATNPYAREYRLLGAPIGSDLKTVQTCWRKLVRENHPDRFAGDPDAERQATARLRKINEAYERLKSHLAGR
jgi:DnaJ-domain-containing protein 1